MQRMENNTRAGWPEYVVDQHADTDGKCVYVCGELAACLDLTETFLAAGIDELSVSLPYILPLREMISESRISEYCHETLSKI